MATYGTPASTVAATDTQATENRNHGASTGKERPTAHLGVPEDELVRGVEDEDEEDVVGEEELAAADVHGAGSTQSVFCETARRER